MTHEQKPESATEIAVRWVSDRKSGEAPSFTRVIEKQRNREATEFRTRAEQVVTIMCEARYSDIIREKGLEELFDTILAEAEARGAANALAEQRRKDAEGAEPVKWQRDNPGIGWIDTPVEDLPFYKERGFPVRPLYSHPANVAALEARVVELVGVNKAWSIAAANALVWLENGRQANARDELKAAQRRAAAVREGVEHG